MAREICARYYREYSDEDTRYGARGEAWCVHDNQHILNWAVLDLCELADLDGQLAWLGRLLGARAFPMDRFVRNLEIASDVVVTRHAGLGARLNRAASEFEAPGG